MLFQCWLQSQSEVVSYPHRTVAVVTAVSDGDTSGQNFGFLTPTCQTGTIFSTAFQKTHPVFTWAPPLFTLACFPTSNKFNGSELISETIVKSSHLKCSFWLVRVFRNRSMKKHELSSENSMAVEPRCFSVDFSVYHKSTSPNERKSDITSVFST